MQVSVVVGKTHSHIFKTVGCNGQNFEVPFPQSQHSFIKAVTKIEIDNQYQECLAVISRQKTCLSSIDTFNKIRQAALHYFNVIVDIDSLQFALNLLKQPDLPSKQMDKLTFHDLIYILKQGHDKIAKKIHSKLNRRIKKYISESLRTQAEKDNIRHLINMMKSDSTDEEVQSWEAQVKANKEKKSEKVGKKGEPQVESQQKISEGQVDHKQKKHRKNHKKHEKAIQKENDENDWVDVKEEKTEKRRQKGQRKRKITQEVMDADSSAQEQAQTIKKPQKRNHKTKQKTNTRFFTHYKQRSERDMRVTLGLFGDTEDNWRERYRIKRVPVYPDPKGTEINPIVIDK